MISWEIYTNSPASTLLATIRHGNRSRKTRTILATMDSMSSAQTRVARRAAGPTLAGSHLHRSGAVAVILYTVYLITVESISDRLYRHGGFLSPVSFSSVRRYCSFSRLYISCLQVFCNQSVCYSHINPICRILSVDFDGVSFKS